MHLLVKISLVILLVLSFQDLRAQDEPILEGENYIYPRAFLGGVTLHTRGWGVNFIYRLRKHETLHHMIEFDIVGMKHLKELKLSNRISRNSSFKYGKKVAMTTFRLGYGLSHTLFEKERKKGVSVSLNYRFGLSLALEKPVYLKIYKAQIDDPDIIEVEERYDEEIHSLSQISGKASALKGFGESKLNVGGFAKLALNFDWSKKYEWIKEIELGAVIDVYSRPVQILAYNPNEQFFFNFYLNFRIGKNLLR